MPVVSADHNLNTVFQFQKDPLMKTICVAVLLVLLPTSSILAQSQTDIILKTFGLDSARSFIEADSTLALEQKASSLIRLYEINPNPQETTEINLSDLGITELPDFILKYQHLTHLNLSNNRLTALPRQLKKLPRLKTLNLSANALQDVDFKLPRLKRVTTLDLSKNQLSVLPRWVKS